MKAGWNTDLQRFFRAVDRVVIGYGNGPKVLCLSEVEDLSRREGTI
jgi:carbamate kinase